MSPDCAAAEIERMKRDLGVELDRDLALDLGIDPTAVSAWRRRNRIPAKYQLRFARIRDERTSRLETGNPVRPTSFDLRDAYIFSLVSLVALKAEREQPGYGGEIDDIWLGFRLAKLYSHLRHNFPQTTDKDALRAALQDWRSKLDDVDLIVWLGNL